MSREILFKGKRKDTGEWATGYYVYNYRHNSHMILFNYNACMNAGLRSRREDFDLQDCEVDPETVCQYTGLTDKKGRKIFEGDIVSFEDCTSTESGYWEQYCVGEVKWSEEEAQFYVTNRLMAESYEVLQDCEVIGNIFDNPELKQ